jgi:hypothetical protein
MPAVRVMLKVYVHNRTGRIIPSYRKEVKQYMKRIIKVLAAAAVMVRERRNNG